MCERKFKSCGFNYDETDNDRLNIHRKKMELKQMCEQMKHK